MIRPNLKKKYHSLCNISTPISTKLFGNDVAKDIKNCDSMSSIGKEQSYMYRQQGFRGRGASRIDILVEVMEILILVMVALVMVDIKM